MYIYAIERNGIINQSRLVFYVNSFLSTSLLQSMEHACGCHWNIVNANDDSIFYVLLLLFCVFYGKIVSIVFLRV